MIALAEWTPQGVVARARQESWAALADQLRGTPGSVSIGPRVSSGGMPDRLARELARMAPGRVYALRFTHDEWAELQPFVGV